MKPADASGPARRLLTAERQIDEITFSHDGQWLVYRLGTGADRDIYAIRAGRDSVGAPLVASEHEERAAALSPDDRWMAYVSNETGRDEIFVCPFPNASSAKWQISTDGGTEPGGELVLVEHWFTEVRALFERN